MNIIGSIDNAWQKSKITNVHHLIFTENEMFIFDVLNKRDIRSEVLEYLRSDPLTMAPIGAVQSYEDLRASKAIHMQIISEAISAGKDVEKNFEEQISKKPPNYREIKYDDISRVILKQGRHLELPSLTFNTAKGKEEFKLMHNNYEKTSKLDQQTFTNYRSTLERALQSKLSVLE